MKTEEARNIFNYLSENVINNTYDSTVDYIINFKNGACFAIDQLGDLLEKYYEISEKIDTHVDDNDLDNVSDFEKVKNALPQYADFIKYDQATMIDFKDFALKIVNEIATGAV